MGPTADGPALSNATARRSDQLNERNPLKSGRRRSLWSMTALFKELLMHTIKSPFRPESNRKPSRTQRRVQRTLCSMRGRFPIYKALRPEEWVHVRWLASCHSERKTT